MPTIHVLYDPQSKISGLSPDTLKYINVTSVVLHIDAPTVDNIDATITNLVEMVLEQVMEKI